jgi:hypothetical protein
LCFEGKVQGYRLLAQGMYSVYNKNWDMNRGLYVHVPAVHTSTYMNWFTMCGPLNPVIAGTKYCSIHKIFLKIYFFIIHILYYSIHPGCHPGLGPASLSGNSCSWAAEGGGGWLGENWTQNWKSTITGQEFKPRTGHQQSSMLTTELHHTPRITLFKLKLLDMR